MPLPLLLSPTRRSRRRRLRRHRSRRSQFERLEARVVLSGLPPVAVDDPDTVTYGPHYHVLRNNPFDSRVPDIFGRLHALLANDSDPEDDPLTAILPGGDPATTTEGGSVTIVDADTGDFVYTPPNPKLLGIDNFTYAANDGTSSSQATATLYVHRAPYAHDDIYVIPPDTDLIVGAPGLLLNDRDPDGDSLEIYSYDPPDVGTLDYVNSDGSFKYVPDPGFIGKATFSYRNDDDGFTSNTAQVHILVTDETTEPFGIVTFPAPTGYGDQQLKDGYAEYQYSIACDCPCDCNVPHSLIPDVVLHSSEGTKDHSPAVNLDADFDGQVPEKVTAQLRVQDWEDKPLFRSEEFEYDSSSFSGTSFHIAIEADLPPDLPTGHYPYSIELIAWNGGEPSTPQTFSGHLDFVSHDRYYDEDEGIYRHGSPLGITGFSLPGLYTVTEVNHYSNDFGGVILSDGTGDAIWLEQEQGAYQIPGGVFLKDFVDGWTFWDKYDTEYQITEVEDGYGVLTAMIDRNGNTTSYTYSPSHRLESITGPFGRVVDFVYDAQDGMLDKIVHWGGGEWDVTVDAQNQRMTSVADPAGNVTTFTYGFGSDDSLLIIDEPGPRQVNISALPGPDSGYQYSVTDGTTTSTWQVIAYRTQGAQGGGSGGGPPLGGGDPLTRTEDVFGKIIDPLGNETEFQIDQFGNVTKTIDDLLRTTRWERDGTSGLVTRLIEPDPDFQGPLASPETLFTWDHSLANLTQVTLPDLNTQSWTYDATFSQVTGFTDELSRVTTWTLDASGNAIQRTDPNTEVTDFTYEGHGLLTSVTLPDPDGAGPRTRPVTSITYDTLGRRTTVTHPDSTTEQMTYDTSDHLLTYTNQLGTQWKFTYDAIGRRLTAREDFGGLDYQTTFAYQHADRQPITVTDPLARQTSYTYHLLGGVATVTTPENSVSYQRDALGQVTRFTDGNLKDTFYEYDAGYRLTKVTLPTGSGGQPIYEFDYDALDRVTSETDPLARVTSYEYDLRDRLTQLTDALLGETDFTYDAVGNLLTGTDPLNRTTSFAYDVNMDWLTSVTQPDPDGGGPLTAPVWTYEHDQLGLVTKTIDPLTNETQFDYDARGRVTKLTEADPDGAGPATAPVWQYTYNGVSDVLTVTDPLAQVTTSQYDALSRLTQVTQPDPDAGGPLAAPVWQYTYDQVHDLVSMTDPLGHVTDYESDALHRLTKVTLPDPDGGGRPVWQYAYDGNGNRASQTDPLGNVTQYTFDGLNQLTNVTEPDPDGPGPESSPIWAFTYDKLGNQLSRTDPLGGVTTHTYDALYRRITTTEPETAGPGSGALWQYAYDAVGNLTTVTGPDPDDLGPQVSPVWQHVYDGLDRRTQTTDPETGVTKFAYDPLGNVTKLTDPENNDTTFVFDGLYRLTQETNELAKSRLYEYDPLGNMTKATDRTGRVREFDYDHLYRRTEERWKDGATTVETLTFAYDGLGQLTSAGDANSNYAYVIDALGRVTQVDNDGTLGPDVILDMAYNQLGSRTELTASIDATDDFKNTYTFDNLQRVTRIEQTGQTGGNSVADKRIDLAYNGLGQFTTITRYADLAGSDKVVESSYTYDGANRLTGLNHQQNYGNILADYSWQYDKLNRVTQFVSSTDGTVDYDYDDTSQLTGADYNYQADETYTYDLSGNRTMSGYSTGANNRLLADGT